MRNRLDPASAAAATTGRRLERSYVAPKKIKSAYDIVAQSYGERQPKQSKATVLNSLLPDSISLAKHHTQNISSISNIQQYGYRLPLHDNEFSKNTDESHLYSTADGSNNTHMMSIHTGNSHKDGCWNAQQLDDKENQNWMSNQIDQEQKGIRQDDSSSNLKKTNKMFKSIEGLSSSNWNPQQSELLMHEGTSKGSNVAVEASSKSSRASTFRSIQQLQNQYQLGLQSRQEFIEQEAAIAAETSNNNQYISQNEVVCQQRGYPIKKNDYLIMEEQRNNNNNLFMSSTSGMPSKPHNNTEQHSFQRDRRHSFEAQPRIERSKTGDTKGSSSLRQLSEQVSQRLSHSLHQNAALFVKSSAGVPREVVVNSFNGMQRSQRNYQNRSNTISSSFRQSSGLSYQQNESITADSQRNQGVLNRSSNQVNSKSTSRIQQQQQEQHSINKKKQQVQQQQQIFERKNQISSNSNDADKENIQRLRETVHSLQIRDASHRLEASKLKKTIAGLRQDLELSKGETATARAQADTDAEYIRQLDGQLSVYVEKLETLQKALDRQIRESSEETRALMSENEELRKQIDDLERIREQSQRRQQQQPAEEQSGYGQGQGQGIMALTNDEDEVDGDSSRNSNYEHQDDDGADEDDDYDDNGEDCDCEECNNNNNNHSNNNETYSELQQQQYAAILPPPLSSYQLKDPNDCSYLPFSHEIITEQAEEDEQSSRVNIHSSSHLSQAQSTAKMININLQALWNNSSRAANNNNISSGYSGDLNSNHNNHNNLGDVSSVLLSSSMLANSKKGSQTQTGRSISQQQLFTQQQQQQRIKQSKSAAGQQKHPRNGSNNNLENHRNLSITSPCDNSNSNNSIYGVNSSKCNSLPDYPSHLSNKATPASQMIVSDCGEYPQNEESIQQLQEREDNSIRLGSSQVVYNQINNNNCKTRHQVDRYQEHQSEEGIDENNSQYGNGNNGQDAQDSMRDIVKFQVNYQEFLNQADTAKNDQQVFQNQQNNKNSSYDYWKRLEQQQPQEEMNEQQQQLRSQENISYLESKQFSTWKGSSVSRTSNNNHNNSHNSSCSWENNNNNNNMIIDPNEFIEDNLLHNNSSADVNCTE